MPEAGQPQPVVRAAGGQRDGGVPVAGQHQRAAQVLRVVAGGEGADAERLVDHLNRQAGRRIARVAVVVAAHQRHRHRRVRGAPGVQRVQQGG